MSAKTIEKMTCPFDWPEVQGLTVKGCIRTGRSPHFGAAHAHCYPEDPNRGWICLSDARQIHDEDPTAPSNTLLHEYAHILVAGGGHNAQWEAVAASLGCVDTRDAFVYPAWTTEGHQAREVARRTKLEKKLGLPLGTISTDGQEWWIRQVLDHLRMGRKYGLPHISPRLDRLTPYGREIVETLPAVIAAALAEQASR